MSPRATHRTVATPARTSPVRRDTGEHFAELSLQELPELIPVRDVVWRLNVSRQTVYALLAMGELSGVRVGNKAIRIFKGSLLDYIRRNLT